MSVPFMVWFQDCRLEGVNLGKSSKSAVKFPCSPHPADGVAVAELGGNGLLKLEDEVVLVTGGEDGRVDVLSLMVAELVEP